MSLIQVLMEKEYNIFSKLVSYIIVAAVLIMLMSHLIPSFISTKRSIVLLLVIISMLTVMFKDYKVVIKDESIIFFSLFRKPKTFKTTDIREINIGDIKVPNRIRGTVRNIVINTDDEKFVFNIHEIENEDFYKDIKIFTYKNNINLKYDKA